VLENGRSGKDTWVISLACKKLCTNQCPCSRFVGTPFPPWDQGTDVWGVQHLLHPDLGESIFAEWYGSEEMINAVCELLEVKPDELQLGG
jgi:hypothetical protein